MSTRAQVLVIQEELGGWEDKVLLYHHTDGYPEYMLPLLAKARSMAGGREAGGAGKVASFLCAADPGVFEPEAGFALHGDIEYLYRLYVANMAGGSMAENPRWEVEVLVPGEGFWDNPDLEHMRILTPRQGLSGLTPVVLLPEDENV